MMTEFAVGSLVRARGRDWVVLPESAEDLLVVRPLGGSIDDVAGILMSAEPVEQARFAAPDPADTGDAVSAGLLRTALRVGFTATTGPFRSLAGLAVEPRPYQLVPLMMALRQESVRLLIADDVGIGKTIEAAIVATELLAQGSARGLAVLCSPALAEQWQAELGSKFRIDAELVLPSTVRRLERGLYDDESIFDRYPYTVVSTDFIKAKRHRDDFVRSCPDMVIVDEAHTCVAEGAAGVSGTLRYELLLKLANDSERHLVLVTATPHSGKEEGFRNLIGLLHKELSSLDLSTTRGRDRLAQHMVQRRRGDIRKYLDEETPFPSIRETQERRYYLKPEYADLFKAVLRYAREIVRDPEGGQLRQRVRYWSALALLRALASSPRAAAATLRKRAKAAEAMDAAEADRIGRASVLDLADDEAMEALDVVPGADDTDAPASSDYRRLMHFARQAEGLAGEGDGDSKLAVLDEAVQALLADGYDPVIFCRFIDTAEYVAERLTRSLRRSAEVACVTGSLPPSDREARIKELTEIDARHVLVATDCLSEGVNLQEHFQAVVHYDLAWNPTRHEQREGRVDRFGQIRDSVRAVTIVGGDNQVDEVVMRVLLRKHDEIRALLGISVPVPDSANQVVEAVLEELLVSEPAYEQGELFSLEDLGRTKRGELHQEWDSSAANEKESRTKFAQAGIRPEEVSRELADARASLGSHSELAHFAAEALDALGASLTQREYGFDAVTRSLPASLRDALPPGHAEPLPFRQDLPVPRRHAHLDRTDPSVRTVARYVLDSALDARRRGPRPARRCGVMRTDAVERRTTLLLMRFRMHLTLPGRDGVRRLVAEEARTLAFTGRGASVEWLSLEAVDALLTARPSANVAADLARDHVARALSALPELAEILDGEAAARAEELRESHVRVREASRRSGSARVRVEPHTPADVLGLYIYLPVAGGNQ